MLKLTSSNIYRLHFQLLCDNDWIMIPPSSRRRIFWWCPTTRYWLLSQSRNSSLISFTFQSTADVPLLMTIFSSRVGFCNKVTDTTSALLSRSFSLLFVFRWCGSWTRSSSSPTLVWWAGCMMTSSSWPAEIIGTPAWFTLRDTSQRWDPSWNGHTPNRPFLFQVFIPKQRKYLVVFPEGGFLHKRREVEFTL